MYKRQLPWIVGETGLSAHPANVNSVDTFYDKGHSAGTLQNQTTFLHETLNAARDYGAAGYSWWEYSDQTPTTGNGLYAGGSVSYTHLDVYKRQGVGYSWWVQTDWSVGNPDSGEYYNRQNGGPFYGLAYSNEGNICLLYTSRCV